MAGHLDTITITEILISHHEDRHTAIDESSTKMATLQPPWSRRQAATSGHHCLVGRRLVTLCCRHRQPGLEALAHSVISFTSL